jgi:hypothetical protein
MPRSMLLATAASLALLFSVGTSDAQMYYGRPYWGGYNYNPYRSYYRPYNVYRPYAYPAYPSYYGPTYYPGTSFYYNTPSYGFYIR